MKSRIGIFIILTCLLVSCANVTQAPSPQPAATLTPATLQASATITHTPARPATPTATTNPTSTLLPTFTPLPPLALSFYRIRIEYTLTSDWGSLEFLNPDGILTGKLIGVTGNPDYAHISKNKIELGRPYTTLGDHPTATMTVDFALTPQVIAAPFSIRSEHGGYMGSSFRVSYVVDGKATFIQDIYHNWVDANNPDTSAAIYPINLQALQKNPAAAVTESVQRPPKLVLAFYYPWFPGYAWSDSTSSSDRPQVPIDDLDPAAIAQQITQAKIAGIDGFIVSYNTDWADERLQVLLDAARAQNFYITLNLETVDNTNQKVWPPEIIKGWLVHAYQSFASQPAFLKVSGRPVIVLYSSSSTPLDTWRGVLASLRAQGVDWMTIGMGYDLTNLGVFDGVHSYGVNDFVATLDQTYMETGAGVRNNALLDDSAGPKIWAATVQPGFDSTPYGNSPVIFPRGSGEFYRSTFEAALHSSPDWIFITSWNEYGENTHIEPSQRDGDLFLQITRQYISKFKNGYSK